MFNEILEKVEDGLHGRNIGLPHRFSKLMEYLPNIQRETYYTIGGDLGTGKTSFVDDMFVQSPIELKTTEKVFILYYSLEVSKIAKLCKFLARRIFIDHNMMVDVNYILSKGKNRISTEVYNLVLNYRDHFDALEDILMIKDSPINPTGIYLDVIKEFNKRFGTVTSGVNNEIVVNFNNESNNAYFIVVIDHIGLVNSEKGNNKKENIDLLSKYLILLRNKLKITPVVVNQFNRSISSTDRHKLHMVVPQLSDFSDTASTQQDANVVLALFYPKRYYIPRINIGEQEINVTEKTRTLHMLKNRDGSDNAQIIMNFEGKIGYFTEI
jgi:replicative DNA helicase